ncbi:MAG: MATE family efflux transporter [Eubacteriaceae bacterium]
MEETVKINNRTFYRNLVVIGIPITMQQLIGTILNMIDTIMIGSLMEEAIAAVGIANRWFFLYSLCLFGLYSGMSIFTSQYWGVRDYKNIRRVLGMALFIGLITGGFFCFVAVVFPKELMSLFIQDPVVIEYGVDYLQIIGITYVLSAVSLAYTFISRSVHLTKIPMIASIIALSINTCFNYLLIYGHFGFPVLGVRGAAIATVLARVIEMLLIFIFVYKVHKEHPLAGKFKELSDWGRKRLKEVLVQTLPVFINDGAWALGNTIYYIAFGFLGASSIAAIQIAFTLSDCFWAFFMGLGSACAVIVGNEIGRNDFKRADLLSKKLIKISFVVSFLGAIIMILLTFPVASLYNISEETKVLLELCILVMGIFLIPKNFDYLLNCGILRAGGDTKFCMLLDIITVWGLAVPLAFISVLVWHLPIYWVIAVVFSHELLKVVFLTYRYQTKKWHKNVIID